MNFILIITSISQVVTNRQFNPIVILYEIRLRKELHYPFAFTMAHVPMAELSSGYESPLLVFWYALFCDTSGLILEGTGYAASWIWYLEAVM